MTDQDRLALHNKLVDACSKVLASHPPEVQSSALAELLATWLGGWPETLREDLLENHLKAMRDLLPVVEVNTPELPASLKRQH